jgi:hypothetical protein
VSLKKGTNDFSLKLRDDIMAIKDNPSLSQLNKIKIVNELLASQWVLLENYNILIPIIIPMTTKPFKSTMPKAFQEKIHISSNATESPNAARRAAYDSILLRYKGKATQVLETAYEMTHGFLNSIPNENSSDILD